MHVDARHKKINKVHFPLSLSIQHKVPSQDFQPFQISSFKLVLVWIQHLLRCVFSVAFFFFWHVFKEIVRLLFMHCSWTAATLFDFSTLVSTSMGPMNNARDPQISHFNNFFIKNWSHNTIHSFKKLFYYNVFSFSKISSIQTDP